MTQCLARSEIAGERRWLASRSSPAIARERRWLASRSSPAIARERRWLASRSSPAIARERRLEDYHVSEFLKSCARYLPFSIAFPSDTHFSYPPATAHTSASPCRRSSSAARALDCSASQLQYVMTGLPLARNSATCVVTVERGIQIAPGT